MTRTYRTEIETRLLVVERHQAAAARIHAEIWPAVDAARSALEAFVLAVAHRATAHRAELNASLRRKGYMEASR